MSKSKKRKTTKREDTDDDLTPKEWQARHDAACAIVARKYCDMFAFWRDCRYKPCRSARRCIGDARHCLDQRWASVPYDLGVAADRRMSAETPPNADRFLWGAHQRAHHSVGKCNPKLPDIRAKREAGKENTTRETTTQSQSPNRSSSQIATVTGAVPLMEMIHQAAGSFLLRFCVKRAPMHASEET